MAKVEKQRARVEETREIGSCLSAGGTGNPVDKSGNINENYRVGLFIPKK